ncbi:MAG: hypothetical protein ACLT9P_01485 [Evtepia gabavorous]
MNVYKSAEHPRCLRRRRLKLSAVLRDIYQPPGSWSSMKALAIIETIRAEQHGDIIRRPVITSDHG